MNIEFRIIFSCVAPLLSGGGDFKKQTMSYEPLTIERVKACNAMPEPIKSTLDNLCECWYKIALNEGKTESEAAEVALDKLGEKILSFSKR